MVRPIEYDRLEVLDSALRAFWNFGYAACSFQILVKETGLSRQGIYNTFGDKEALFRTSITHYKTKVAEQLAELNEPGSDLEDVCKFIEGSIHAQQNAGPGACFLVITAFGSQAHDPKIKSAIEDGADMVRRAFENALAHEKARGRVRVELSVSDTAAFLYSVMSGLSALAKTGGTQAQCDAALYYAIQSLQHQNGGLK